MTEINKKSPGLADILKTNLMLEQAYNQCYALFYSSILSFQLTLEMYKKIRVSLLLANLLDILKGLMSYDPIDTLLIDF